MMTLSVFSRACFVCITGCGHESPRQSMTFGMGRAFLLGSCGNLSYCLKGQGYLLLGGEVSGAQAEGPLGEGVDGLVGCRGAVEARAAHDGECLVELHRHL